MKTVLPFLLALLPLLGLHAQPLTPLETVAEFGRHQPIGLAVSHQNRIFVTFPKRPADYDFGLVELVNGNRMPYPNAEWNQYDAGKPHDRFMYVHALFVDKTDALWVLDNGKPGVKLLKINLNTNQVERIYRFEDLPLDKTALNDVQVDAEHQVAYLSDPGQAAIVVLDLKTGKSRSVLAGSAPTTANPNFVLTIDGKDVRDQQGKPFSSNVNGIALTPDYRYVYFRPITQTKLFRIRADALRNPNLTDADLLKQVETVAETGVSHGMIADKKGNIFLTDSPNHAVRYVSPDGTLHTLTQDNRLLWPDSFGIGTNGYLYLTAAQLHRGPIFNQGQATYAYPFRLYRMKLP